MEFKGTPGPWVVGTHQHAEYGSLENCKHSIMASGDLPYQLATVVYDELFEKAAHNARLIAISPDLLEALENLLWHAEQIEHFQESERGKGLSIDQLYEAGEMHAYMVSAKALISRAKGEK